MRVIKVRHNGFDGKFGTLPYGKCEVDECKALHFSDAVALVEISDDSLEDWKALEIAWELTNNIDSSWSLEPNENVCVLGNLHKEFVEEIGYRSSMIGDTFEIIKDKEIVGTYEVDRMGFKEVTK
tara:strand:+ start:2315 stop:2689 length:375 start_codon:yes stop_codon:yes gene_type:complete